jgi:aspartate/methionine/tyrosine aminotransferase
MCMKVERFEMERYQSTWEPVVQYNLADSGVYPLTLAALVDHSWIREVLAREQIGYGHTNGSPELRAAIAGLYPGAGPENVLVTSGSAEANFLVSWALLEPGDDVVVMLPTYMQMPLLARAWGAQVRPWWLRESLNWAPDPDELPRLVTDRTRAIIVCNPNNPTGAVLSAEAMHAVSAAADRVGAWVVADEVYRGAELDGSPTPSFWGRSPRTIVTGGLSKAYGLPGLRIGWVVAPAEVVATLWGYHDYTTIAPSVLSDHLARVALGPRAHHRLATRTRLVLTENLSLVRQWVEGTDGLVRWVPPRAGAVAFVRYRPAVNSTELATRLRQAHDVLVVPGDHFQMDGYMRIGYGGEGRRLQEGLRRLGDFLRSLEG